MKTVPRFWWDFVDDATGIIVQSDHPKYPVLKRIQIMGSDATLEITEAQQLVCDLREGRVTMKSIKERKRRC